MIENYRKKPEIIQAVQYTGEKENVKEICNFCKEVIESRERTGKMVIVIPVLRGEITVSLGDYIIKGVNGEFYLYKPDIFEKTYEKEQDQTK